MDGGGINLVEVFKISIDFLSGSEDVDIGGFNLPGTSSASAFWHNVTEVVPLLSFGGFENAFWVATKLSGSINEVFSENFMHILNSLFVFFPCNLNSTVELVVISCVGSSNFTSGRFVLLSEFFSLLWGGVSINGLASVINEAFI